MPATLVSEIEREHIADAEIETGTHCSGNANHLRGKIDTTNLDTMIVEIFCDMTGTAPQICNEPSGFHRFGKPVEQVTVERLSLELCKEVLGISGRS